MLYEIAFLAVGGVGSWSWPVQLLPAHAPVTTILRLQSDGIDDDPDPLIGLFAATGTIRVDATTDVPGFRSRSYRCSGPASVLQRRDDESWLAFQLEIEFADCIDIEDGAEIRDVLVSLNEIFPTVRDPNTFPSSESLFANFDGRSVIVTIQGGIEGLPSIYFGQHIQEIPEPGAAFALLTALGTVAGLRRHAAASRSRVPRSKSSAVIPRRFRWSR